MLLFIFFGLSLYKPITLDKKQQSYQQDLLFIKKAKQNKDAFGLLYEKYWEPLFKFIFIKVQSLDDTGDICQATMLKAMLNISKYEDRGYPFSAWLYRIAINEINLYYRRKKKDKFVEIKETDVQTLMTEIKISDVNSIGEQEKLLVILSQLKPKQAEIVEMRFFFRYSFKEIADFYNITEASAKMRLYRILDKIKQNWTK